MAVENSPIRPKGVGKDAKRHDLDGTPGLHGSDLQYGDVSKLQAGQRAVQNTVNRAPQANPAPAAPSGGGMAVPDPLTLAAQKAGGGTSVPPTERIQPINTSQWLPLIEQLATSNSSSLLKKQYIKMLSDMQKNPYASSGTALIDVQDYDDAVERAFGT